MEVVDFSFLLVNHPRSSSMEMRLFSWSGEGSFEKMSMTMVLAIFLGGFLADEEALEVIFEMCEEGFVVRFL
ncbi:hypothetical protein Tco_1525714, partial [Tanacetum coccineum]